jgi:tetratricopeptide (TPR) repeat protein
MRRAPNPILVALAGVVLVPAAAAASPRDSSGPAAPVARVDTLLAQKEGPPRISNEERLERARRIAEAKRLVQMGRVELAVSRLRQLLEERPEDIEALEALGWVYQESGRREEAEKVYRFLLEQNPDSRQAYRSLGEIRFMDGDVEAAVSVWEEMIERTPKDPGVYRFVGAVEMSHQLYQEAEDLYRRGRETCGIPTLFAGELARLAMLQGRAVDAVDELLLQLRDNKAHYPVVLSEMTGLVEDLEDPSEVETALLERSEDRGIAPEVQGLLAHLRIGRDDVAGAGEAFRYRLEHRQVSSRERMEFAQACLEKRDPWGRAEPSARSLGLEVLEGLFESGRKDQQVPAAGLMLAGELLASLEEPGRRLEQEERESRLARAQEVLDELMERYPEGYYGIEARLLEGRLLLRERHEPGAAYRLIEEFLARAPEGSDRREAVVEAGRCLLALERYDEARDVFSRLAASPREIDQGTSAYHMALTDLLEGKTDEAFEGFTQFAENYPHLDEANDALDLAWVLELSRQEEEGAIVSSWIELVRSNLAHRLDAELEVLDRMIEQFPDSPVRPRALSERGDVAFEAGEFDVALTAYRELLEEYPDNRLAASALHGMGRVYLLAFNDPERALFEYEMILTRYPDYVFLDEVRDGIRIMRERTGETEETP